jgi:hypothetical protein
MSTLTSYTRNAKAILLTGTLLLITISAFAQQEVDPEHFDQPIVAQKRSVAKPHKQVATVHKPVKTTTPPKSRQASAVARKNSEQSKVVTVAAR